MRTIVVLTGSRALLGQSEDLSSRPLAIYPTNVSLTEEEEDIIQLNTGFSVIPIHYPHMIEDKVIGGIIDVTDAPVHPLSQDDK